MVRTHEHCRELWFYHLFVYFCGAWGVVGKFCARERHGLIFFLNTTLWFPHRNEITGGEREEADDILQSIPGEGRWKLRWGVCDGGCTKYKEASGYVLNI